MSPEFVGGFFTTGLPWWLSVQFSCSVVSESLQPHEPQQARPPCCHHLPESTQTHVHQVSDAVQPSHPLLSPSPHALKLSQHQGLFKWVSSSHQGAKALELQLQHQSLQDWYSGLISFGIYGFDLLAVQGTVKSLLQHHSPKASIFWHSDFLIFQLSYPYMTTGKTIASTRQTFVAKVISLLFNMLSRLVIAFLPRSEPLLISWLQSPSAVILEPPKIKSATISAVSQSICHEVMGLDPMIFVFWMLSFKLTFSLSFFTFIKKLLSSSSLSAIRVVSSEVIDISPGNLGSSFYFPWNDGTRCHGFHFWMLSF